MNKHYFYLPQISSAQAIQWIQEFNSLNAGKHVIYLAFFQRLTDEQIKSNAELGKNLLAYGDFDLCWSMFSLKATLDMEVVKKCIKEDVRFLNSALAHITGNITIMRTLCEINPECANWATGKVLTKADANWGTSQESAQKVYQWLMATGLRKALKSKDVLKVASSNTQPKPTFKI
ncbi:hypothetical protein [Variovorax sp. W2I14]|uniref:hypothetical protein n=1 Tax=Variovorax sp. W2I14 TaxID=3042290 RepID=UPI003D1BAFBD